MTELLKFIQASNGAFKSDLMNSFVSDYKGQLSQSLGADPGYVGVSTGASFFAPPSTLTAPPTTTTTTPGSPASAETDNANANLIQEGRTDNVQTSAGQNQNNGNTTESNQNTINANRTTATTTTTTTTTAAASTTSSEEPDTNANMSEVAAVLAEVRGALTETRQLLVQQVTEATVDAHQATCLNMQHAVQEARGRFTREAGQLPDMSKLSLSASAMWGKMMEQMMPELGKTIKFFKLLPGFNELCLDDQMLLIKQGTFEVMMTRFSMLIDHEKETMLDPSHNMVCPREVVKKMPMGEFLDGFFRVGSRFNPIGLKDGEIGVFTAVLAFSPNRPSLTEPKLVGTIRSLYLHALFKLMKQNHSDPETKFSQVLGLVPMFRQMSEEHSKTLGAMKMQDPDAFDKQFPQVHKEMYVQQQ